MNEEQSPKTPPASPIETKADNVSLNTDIISPKTILHKDAIRTYESDVAKVLAQRKTSVTTIAISESKRNNGVEGISDKTTRNGPKQIIIFVSSIMFIGSGITLGYYLYLKSPLSTPSVPLEVMEIINIIPSDKKIYLSVDELSNKQLIPEIYSQFNKNSLENGKIMELILQEEKIISNKKKEINPLSASSFIKKINTNIPDVLIRSLKDFWILGAYNEEGGQKTPFIGLTTDFFQNAFAGMLSWEKSMPDDLSLILDYERKARLSNPMSSSTISSYLGIQGSFVDRQIRNRDVREFVDKNGQLLFLYSFLDKEHLILTTTESAFVALILRIEKQSYVR